MKNTQTLRQLFVENGMNKGWATRRANQAAKAGNLYVNALTTTVHNHYTRKNGAERSLLGGKNDH